MKTLTRVSAPVILWAALLPGAANANAIEDRLMDMIEDRSNEWLAENLPYLKINYANHDDEEQKDGWIVDYDWSRSKNTIDIPKTQLSTLKEGTAQKFRMIDSGFTAHAKGSYAYSDTTNSNDLSSAGLAFHLRVIDQGLLVKMNEEDRIDSVTCINELELPEQDTSEAEAAYNAQTYKCSAAYFQLLEEHSTHTYAYDLQFDYQVEANQDYTEHQEVLSMGTTLVFEPAIGSAWQTANILDYPFRYITRPLFSHDASYNAKWPSLHLAYGKVDPSKNTVRNVLPEGDESYNRWNAEIAFQSTVARIANRSIVFEASYRVYQEVSAPDAIKDAGLDKFTYSTASLFAPASLFGIELEGHEVYLTYAHGKLPFDISTKDTLMLGWKFNFNDLLGALMAGE